MQTRSRGDHHMKVKAKFGVHSQPEQPVLSTGSTSPQRMFCRQLLEVCKSPETVWLTRHCGDGELSTDPEQCTWEGRSTPELIKSGGWIYRCSFQEHPL